MKCEQIHELLAIYWDLPEEDGRRTQVDEHILHCSSCREEFEIWKESTDLIRTTITEEKHAMESSSLSHNVMERIYRNESWRIPVQDRIYTISYKLRRNLTAVIAFCLALFMFSFLYSIVYQEPVQETAAESVSFGLQPVAVVSGDDEPAINTAKLTASIGPRDPLKYSVGPIDNVPDYMLVLSLLGMISTILIMNWFSRTKA